ncbi:MAG: hypothetical protein HY791_09580 [Deltaproteobacteria bacterium]|nr:hypothetical protein [Deltaproteobacteria bacterium]
MVPLILLALGAPGTLAPSFTAKGCSFVAISSALPTPIPSPDGAELEVPPGEYSLRVFCEPSLALSVPSVKVASAKVTKLKVEVRPTAARVLAKRGSALRQGTVRLYPVGGPYEDPLAEHPANQKFTAAEGRFDLVVALAGEPGELLLRKVELKGKKVRTIDAAFDPGTVTVEALQNEKKTDAIVRLFRAQDPSPVAEEHAGVPISVAPGRYQLEVALAAAADFRSARELIWILPNKATKVTRKFTSGKITVRVTSSGRSIPSVVRLRMPGASDFFNYFKSPGSAVLAPGRYDVILEPEGLEGMARHERLDVLVEAKQETRVDVDLTPATVIFEVRQDGTPMPIEAVEILSGGGGRLSIRPNADGEYKLWPGRYEFVVHLASGRVARDGPFDVSFGASITRVVELSVGTIKVRPERDGVIDDEATVYAFRPGAAEAVAKGRGACELPLAPGIYDIKVGSGAITAWREGVRVEAKKSVTVVVPLVGATHEAPPGESPEAPLPEGDAP